MKHRLQLRTLELVGGGRKIPFPHTVNVVRGPITTGKTTFVRLVRALLGSVPDNLPREATSYVKALRGDVELETGRWRIDRPLVTTDTANVELGKVTEDTVSLEALRLPAVRSRAPEGPTYARWLLDQLGLPFVEVPRARTQVTSPMVPVTINDWLNYCIIPGDEIDTAVFGHNDPFRDIKRRYVFELIYGLYDPETARLQGKLRQVELYREALARQAATAAEFLADTAFADAAALTKTINHAREQLIQLAGREAAVAQGVHDELGTTDLRDRVQASEQHLAELRAEAKRTEDQLVDLRDLRTQLTTQSARLTRAIVAGEWLVDFDFVVCPRCGNKVDESRTDNPATCYLCLQPVRESDSRDSLIAEQERVAAQVGETDEVLAFRQQALDELRREITQAEAKAHTLSLELEERTRSFINEQTAALVNFAAQRARLEGEIQRAEEYLALLRRQADIETTRDQLDGQREELLAALERRALSRGDAGDNVTALEHRLYEYLQRLNVPVLGDLLSARIDRRTYLPIVSGRQFDELSSQGLEVLVNVAHALAHHTVAIDRGLPLPGLLVLDGLSSNVGREGFDAARVDDMYQLILSVAETYADRLQIIAVDNDPPHFVDDHVVLSMDQDDRLIRTAAPSLSNGESGS
jgi:hypothetical protein